MSVKSIEMAKAIELWPVERLQPYARNPRTHTAEQIDKLAASIIEFGFTNPILVDGEAGIIAGHGRLLAAQKVGMVEVPVIELTHMTEAQKRAYVIADNRLALDAGWDDALLKAELEAIQEMEYDLALTGFTEPELSGIMLDKEYGETDPDKEWEGMPEFDQKDKTAYKQITVSFASEEDMRNFAALVGQTITEKTRSIWYPEAEIETYADKSYE